MTVGLKFNREWPDLALSQVEAGALGNRASGTKSRRVVKYTSACRLERGGSMFRIADIALLLAFLVAALGCSGGPVSGVSTARGGSNHSGDPRSPSTVSIYPASETLRTGSQRRFSGWDTSVGQYDVTWSLQEGAAAGTITTDGIYTAPPHSRHISSHCYI